MTTPSVDKLQRETAISIVDQMNLAAMAPTVRASFAAMDAVQRENPGVQVLALAALLLMYCKKYDVNPRDVLYKAGAVITDAANQNNEHVGAIARFMKVHLKGETSNLL